MSLDKAYEIDPYNERVVELIIHYYGKQKNIYNLEVFFNDYSRGLWEDMKLKPIKSTKEIYKKYMGQN